MLTDLATSLFLQHTCKVFASSAQLNFHYSEQLVVSILATLTLHSAMASLTLPDRLVGVNLKMYFDAPSTTSYLTAIAKFVAPPAAIATGIFILPSYPCLASASDLLEKTPDVMLGAQDCHAEDGGPHTGEVSPLMLKQVGCRIVCVGHAERRGAPFNETDDVVLAKAQAVVRNGMIPLICIGEGGDLQSTSYLESPSRALHECNLQVVEILGGILDDVPIIFAYEPVWAIGAQEPASAHHVLTIVKGLRDTLRKFGGVTNVKIIYGGSAKPGTWRELKEEVDGLFLGRFAHDVRNFEQVVREMEES